MTSNTRMILLWGGMMAVTGLAGYYASGKRLLGAAAGAAVPPVAFYAFFRATGPGQQGH